MIIEFLFNIFKFLLINVFSFIKFPSFPVELTNSIDWFLDTLFDNLSMVSLFIRWPTVKLVAPILIVLINFEKVYKLVMWILRKLPFLGIS